MHIFVNNKKINVVPGQTILKAVPEDVAFIPALCHHPDLKIKANCRVCLVELEDGRLVTSCSTRVENGMKIFTDTPKVKKARKINLELIFAEHIEKCSDCLWDNNCQLKDLAKKYQVKITRFPERKKDRDIKIFSDTIIFDQTKCVECGNCVEVCQNQGVNFLEIKGSAHETVVGPTEDKTKDCTTCGQCILHCPYGAIHAKAHIAEVEKALKDPKKIVIVQTAPAVRVSIGEEFGMNPGEVVTGKMVSGLKKMGFDYVFDTNLGADITTFEEAGECYANMLKDKLTLTSCCPAWVKFVEFYYPEFIKNISTTRSPQSCLGSVIKTYFAKKKGINPKDIIVVSVMPCTAKKFEINRPEQKTGKLKTVDYVITTRECAFMMRGKKINLSRLKDENFDHPLGKSSGAAAIYGASGGVMESALRTALEYHAGLKLKNIEFKKVRGLEGIKKTVINVKGKKVKIAVVGGLGKAKEILEEIKSGKEKYHVIEVMACPGGCLAGGGQPVPTNHAIRSARMKALYEIDKNKKIRKAHENPDLLEIYKEYAKTKKIRHELFHTKNYKQKRHGSKNYH